MAVGRGWPSWNAKGWGEHTGKSYRLLSRILGTAIESGYLARNPCTIRGAAAEPAPEMRFAAVTEVAALADAIPGGSGRWSWSPPTPACAGGSWPGCGSVGWTCCTARSRWPSSSWRVRGRLAFGPTKTGAGRRTVTLPTVAAEALPST